MDAIFDLPDSVVSSVARAEGQGTVEGNIKGMLARLHYFNESFITQLKEVANDSKDNNFTEQLQKLIDDSQNNNFIEQMQKLIDSSKDSALTEQVQELINDFKKSKSESGSALSEFEAKISQINLQLGIKSLDGGEGIATGWDSALKGFRAAENSPSTQRLFSEHFLPGFKNNALAESIELGEQLQGSDNEALSKLGDEYLEQLKDVSQRYDEVTKSCQESHSK